MVNQLTTAFSESHFRRGLKGCDYNIGQTFQCLEMDWKSLYQNHSISLVRMTDCRQSESQNQLLNTPQVCFKAINKKMKGPIKK